MGCGVSRPVLEHEDAPPPPGLRPIRRRIEEIRRNRNAHKRSQSHLSSKELLHDDDVDSRLTDEEDFHPRKSVSLPLESINEADHNQSPPLEKHKPNKKEEVIMIESLGNVVTEVVMVDKPEEKTQEHHQYKVEEEQHFLHQRHEQEDEEDEEEEDCGYGSDFGPASPSFREYCVFSADTDSMDSTEFGKDESKIEEETEGEKKEYISAVKSVEDVGVKREERPPKNVIVSSEGSIVLVKKEHRVRKFKRVLPKGSQVAMKNLLNVKGCYIPPCATSGSHNNNRNAPTST